VWSDVLDVLAMFHCRVPGNLAEEKSGPPGEEHLKGVSFEHRPMSLRMRESVAGGLVAG